MMSSFGRMLDDLQGENAQAGLRQVALALHAHAADDRQWLLARLTETQRLAIEPLLTELAALQVDPSLVQLTVRRQVQYPFVDLQQVERLSAELSQEPPALVAAVLSLCPDGLRRSLDENMRGNVLMAPEKQTITTHLANLPPAMKNSLSRRLNQVLEVSTNSPTAEVEIQASTPRLQKWWSLLCRRFAP